MLSLLLFQWLDVLLSHKQLHKISVKTKKNGPENYFSAGTTTQGLMEKVSKLNIPTH